MTSLRRDEKGGILYRRWQAPSPKTVLLLVHGICSHSERWQFLADYFLNNDISSYAIELEGFTQAGSSKGPPESFDLYFRNIHRLRDIIKEECPAAKIVILGESAGALISFLMAALEPSSFEALICVSPAFKSKLPFRPSDYLGIFLSALSDPERPCPVPISSEMCTRDTDYRKIMDSEVKGERRITSRLLVDMAIAQIRSGILKNRITIPVLFLLAGEDAIVDPGSSVRIFKGLKTADKKMIRYPGMRHSLTIELGRESIFQDILNWLSNTVIASPAKRGEAISRS